MARKGHQTPLTIWSLCLCPQRHEWSSSNKALNGMNEVLAIRCDIHKSLHFFPALWETQRRDGRDLRLREHLWLSSRCRTCPSEGLCDAAFGNRNETKIGRHDGCNLPTFFPGIQETEFFRETTILGWKTALGASLEDPTSEKSRLSLPPSPGRGIFATPAVCQVELVRKLRDM